MFSHKDLVSTILIVIVGILVYLDSTGVMLPFSNHYRVSTVILLVLGLAICAFGSKAAWPIKKSSPLVALSAALGVFALVIGIIGVIIGNQFFFYLLAAIIVSLWGITTLRHVVS